MERTIIKHALFLRKLAKASRYQRHCQIAMAKDSQIQALKQIAHGFIEGTIPIKMGTFQKLIRGRFRPHIYTIADNDVDICKSRHNLIRFGGWLEYVLPEAITRAEKYVTTPRSLRDSCSKTGNESDETAETSSSDEDDNNQSEDDKFECENSRTKRIKLV